MHIRWVAAVFVSCGFVAALAFDLACAILLDAIANSLADRVEHEARRRAVADGGDRRAEHLHAVAREDAGPPRPSGPAHEENPG